MEGWQEGLLEGEKKLDLEKRWQADRRQADPRRAEQTATRLTLGFYQRK